jgi:hypothetical protein
MRNILLTSVVLVSCGKSGALEDTSETATTDSGTTSTTVTTDTATGTTRTTDTGGWEPMQGRYTLIPGAILTNECGDYDVAPEPNNTATAMFSWNGDKISIVFEGEHVECDWEYPGFSLCVVSDESEGQQGTTLNYQNSIDGQWSEPEAMSGTSHFAIDCTGNGCEMFANQMNITSFPCAVSMEYTGEM